MGKNTKKRQDDKRGYKEWTRESRDKVRKSSTRYPELQDKEWLVKQYEKLQKTTVEIAKELGCVVSTVYVALKRQGLSPRTISEARIGIKFTDEHLSNITEANRKKALSGSDHWNWQGGITKEGEKRRARIKRNPKYKAWRKAVISIGHCEACGSKKNLRGHHILPKSKFPHLIHDINNGKCLCRNCHIRLHSKSDEFRETRPGNAEGNPEPSFLKVEEGAETTGEKCTSLNNQHERPTRKG